MPRYALLFSIFFLLSACGFHLRGTESSRFAIDEINLEARNRYGETVKELRDALKKRGVQVRSGAFPTLLLSEEKQQARALGRAGSAQTVEMELQLTLDYQLLGKNRLLLSEDTLQVRRIYVQDDNNIAANNGEQEQLVREMRRDLLGQLLMRLQALTPGQLDDWQRRVEQQQAQEEAERRLRANETVAPQ